jgi:hypothetical protein
MQDRRSGHHGSGPRRALMLVFAGVFIVGCSSSHHAAAPRPTTITTAARPTSRSTRSEPSTERSSSTTTTGGLDGDGVVAEPGCAADGGQRSVRPNSFLLACADGNARVEDAHWTDWTNQQARGTGTLVENDCRPSCALGRFHSATADLTLDQPQRFQGHLVFTLLTAQLHAPLAPNPGMTATFHLI